MSLPKSFMNYMKIMRDYYKSGATSTDALPSDFNFDDIEIEANLYGFNLNDSQVVNNSYAFNFDDEGNSSHSNENSALASAKLGENSSAMYTDVITIQLFDQDDRVHNVSNK